MAFIKINILYILIKKVKKRDKYYIFDFYSLYFFYLILTYINIFYYNFIF